MLDKKGFDLWADGYDRSVGLSDEDHSFPFAGYKDVLNAIYAEVLAKGKVRILDIGFGTGTLTTRLYEQGCQVSGVDFSERMCELAGAKMPEAKLVCADFSKGLPEELKSQTYDAIIGTYSLHHLTDDEKTAFLQSLLPLLAEDGKILIGDVVFETRAQLEECRAQNEDDWDEDEIYFVYEELKEQISCAMRMQRMSFCAGVLILEI